ncbi:MAG: hypothetical protein AAGA30_15880 [Planctomycetota bacterium]
MVNRFSNQKPDYLLVIIRRPDGFRPKNHFEKPTVGTAQIVEVSPVASYAEAHDDLVRCNRLSLYKSLDTWAVIKTARKQSSF